MYASFGIVFYKVAVLHEKGLDETEKGIFYLVDFGQMATALEVTCGLWLWLRTDEDVSRA